MSSVYRSLSKKPTKPSNGTPTTAAEPDKRINKQRLLALTSRGVTYRHRHLLADLTSLLPHSRKDAKLDSKSQLSQLNELADLYNCNNILYLEARKAKDLYLWLSKPPNGPTIKFHAQNIHTMEELNFTGNCLRGSRPVLSFDKSFELLAHTRLIKEVLVHTFGVPERSRKVKPFVDHVMGFTIVGDKIWVRVYQITETEATKGGKVGEEEGSAAAASISAPKDGGRGDTSISLVEIGPRFVLTPIVILEGSFGGPVIYENKEFVSPNQIRSDLRRGKAGRYNNRAEGTLERKVKKRDLGLRTGEGRKEVDEMDDRVLFA
ncbi:Ribosome biogenesis protein brx1 [Elasticomyces elasticus]|uniref:Ribosome biogenesis protein brx1 n=1 Tax=Elasticomyces elasticus TaxID=574655 RepID=A0AAN7ZW46_9PEZI|nr:Ribosome biogenesis protein brx1 [Elasticomyces elasticus]KAK5713114.1 Ribosome biogenesis protein brx1 [Elasticomyces elasticus]